MGLGWAGVGGLAGGGGLGEMSSSLAKRTALAVEGFGGFWRPLLAG